MSDGLQMLVTEVSRGRPRGKNGKKHVEVWACWHCYRAEKRWRNGGIWSKIWTTRGPKRHYILDYNRKSACGMDPASKAGR